MRPTRWISGAALLVTAACGSSGTNNNPGVGGSGASGGSGGSTSTQTQSGGAGGEGLTGPCDPGDEVDCYTGPAGTLDVGLCRGGTATCTEEGTWGACAGEVLPEPESCLTPDDEDCDGQTNEGGEGCVCTPNQSQYCYSGDPLTENVGVCVGGIRECNAQGTAWGACTGEVTPQAEDCNTQGIDEDCDGLTPVCPATWSLVFGDNKPQVVKAVVTDASGNVYFAGELEGTITIGGANHTSAGATDAIVGKLDPDGNRIWTRIAGNAELQGALALAVDSAGDVWVTGYHRGTINWGGSNLSTALGSNVYLAKLRGTDGAHLFSATYGSSAATSDEVGSALAVDASDNVWMAGHISSSTNFGGSALAPSPTGVPDAFVAKFTSAGAHLFSARYGDTNFQYATGITVGPNGEVFATGHFRGTIHLGGSALTSAGLGDVWVTELTSAGAHVWSASFGDTGEQLARAITVGLGGGPVVAGEFEGDVDFGGGALASAGQLDVFLVELAPTDGAHVASRRFGGAGSESALAVAWDAGGYLILGGYTTGSVDFGTTLITSLGGRDGFVAKLDDMAFGATWVRSFGDASFHQEAAGVAVDPNGNVVAGGQFTGQADLGSGTVTSAGSTDGFIAKYPP